MQERRLERAKTTPSESAARPVRGPVISAQEAARRYSRQSLPEVDSSLRALLLEDAEPQSRAQSPLTALVLSAEATATPRATVHRVSLGSVAGAAGATVERPTVRKPPRPAPAVARMPSLGTADGGGGLVTKARSDGPVSARARIHGEAAGEASGVAGGVARRSCVERMLSSEEVEHCADNAYDWFRSTKVINQRRQATEEKMAGVRRQRSSSKEEPKPPPAWAAAASSVPRPVPEPPVVEVAAAAAAGPRVPEAEPSTVTRVPREERRSSSVATATAKEEETPRRPERATPRVPGQSLMEKFGYGVRPRTEARPRHEVDAKLAEEARGKAKRGSNPLMEVKAGDNDLLQRLRRRAQTVR